ncbi:cytochrome P450 [Actinophytocola algeriensis]|uniref:Cytochrome P450 n=1 Tax=Actinophytocola algeriensis TaxID=1768010 RepID=A0A7W7VFW6_9PSEU|nr:cytochrome P450 [Actinophytocola algeriensis]MBB4908445.1 cytochrome P450 [Actinophytocola algeriensis]MBE1475168.1 cytochrome P450 [Actinophytocola algeriensis]
MTDVVRRTEAVPLYGDRYQTDPAGLYAEIRETHGPVAPVLLEGDIPAWFVCGYRELHQVTTDAALFARDTRRWNAWETVPDDWPLLPHLVHNPSVMFTEGPEHRRRAGALSDALESVDQFELANQCERIADQMIDRFAGAGEAELMGQYASRIPLSATAMMCGVPESEARILVDDVMGALNSSMANQMAVYGRMQEEMQRLVDRKRALPGVDVPSHLLADPANLGDEEILSDLLVVLLQAHQQTTNWIGNTIGLMLTDERLAVTLSGGRSSVGDALNEVLWHDTPTQNYLGRVATRDTRLGGQRIRAGDLLVLGLAAANADPQVKPEGTAGTAGNRAMMSFGHGEHGCPYPAPELAEIIAKTSVEVLIDRLPDLVLSEELEWRSSVWTRGLVRLPVTFTPTYVP